MSDTSTDPKATTAGRCWGLKLSSAKKAGDKTYLAELDPVKKEIVALARPWKGQEIQKILPDIALWISVVKDAWVGVDCRLGLPQSVVSQLLPPGLASQVEVARSVTSKFGTFSEFQEAFSQVQGHRERRRTDTNETAPLDVKHDKQTYWALRLLAVLPPEVALLPQDHAKVSQVKLVEVSPVKYAQEHGMGNYKKSKEVCQKLLDFTLARKGWSFKQQGDRTTAIEAQNGAALDAVISGLQAHYASEHTQEQHEKWAKKHGGEGYIYG